MTVAKPDSNRSHDRGRRHLGHALHKKAKKKNMSATSGSPPLPSGGNYRWWGTTL